ncbi:type II toxin-antitoxin system RelE/ParE family toxin [Treponema pectinovorum]|uniref:type II toxin-antitoxin system RelE/ParE family toxin n=1 Tax=Treponema pectinovorum TaxID=164 RepID=UPI0011CAA245|nr:type II toxin-antitoxin system RelE/ParE family toxin [Treponema pectinovorum]
MYRKVVFYKTLDGKCPVAQFIDSQSPKVAAKIAWVLKIIQDLEKIPTTYFKKLTNTDFYECRIEFSGNIYRFLGFFHNGNLVVLTNGFQKKTQKTPQNELEICRERMNDFLRRNGGKK